MEIKGVPLLQNFKFMVFWAHNTMRGHYLNIYILLEHPNRNLMSKTFGHSRGQVTDAIYKYLHQPLQLHSNCILWQVIIMCGLLIDYIRLKANVFYTIFEPSLKLLLTIKVKICHLGSELPHKLGSAYQILPVDVFTKFI